VCKVIRLIHSNVTHYVYAYKLFPFLVELFNRHISTSLNKFNYILQHTV